MLYFELINLLDSAEICNNALREFFYMCPPCDDTCDFWYYRSTCAFAHVSLLFDYGGTVFFAAFMACWGKELYMYMLSNTHVIDCNLLCIYVKFRKLLF